MATITVEVEKCSIDGCDRPATAAGYCASHYRRFKLHGDPLHTARKFHGIPTKVVGISIPQALIDAAGGEAGEGEKAVTVLARKLVEGSWGKKVLDEAGVDLKNAGAVIVPRKRGEEVEEKPAKKKKAKKTAEAA